MRILIDDGMQIKVGTGIGKYSLYLYKELKKHLEKRTVLNYCNLIREVVQKTRKIEVSLIYQFK